MNLKKIDEFFRYARRREIVRLNREQGFPKPWTDDPILQEYRFCNINREDDVVTKWIRERITHERYGERLLGALIIARWFNRIETLELMYWDRDKYGEMKYDDVFSCWADNMEAWESVMRETLKDQKPLVTAAYMIKTPAKMDKLSGLIWILQQILPHAIELYHGIGLNGPGETTLEGFCETIGEYPFFGPFYSYEIACDMYQTPGSPLQDAPDILTWANPGPGAARGLCRLCMEDFSFFNRNKKEDVYYMNQLMGDLLRLSRNPSNWSEVWKPWDMRTVEHTLCEFDKYERVRLGEGKPKQRFNGKA